MDGECAGTATTGVKERKLRLSSAKWSLAADGIGFRTATVADVGHDVVGGDDAEGKKCKDDVHDLLLWCVEGPLIHGFYPCMSFRSNSLAKVSVSCVNSCVNRCVKSCSTKTAASLEKRAGDPTGVVGGDEGDDVGDVIRLAGAAERRLRDEAGFKV